MRRSFRVGLLQYENRSLSMSIRKSAFWGLQLRFQGSHEYKDHSKRRGGKHIHFENVNVVPAIEPLLCPVIFDLNGFNSALTSRCQKTEMAASFSAHQSFIITRIHQPILVITDYRLPVRIRETHTHTLIRNQKHISTLKV